MMYEGIANVYDHMMNHIPYEAWFENLLQYLHEKGVLSGRICELGCGTGVMTETFAAAGYDMSGLNELFGRVKTYVKPGGYFIFDLKTAYCYRNIIGNQTWVEQDEEVSYIWENYFYEDQDINEYMLTIFRKQADSELYERTEESHYQRAYDMDTLKGLIEKNGLTLVSFLDEDMKRLPDETSERIYVIVQA